MSANATPHEPAAIPTARELSDLTNVLLAVAGEIDALHMELDRRVSDHFTTIEEYLRVKSGEAPPKEAFPFEFDAAQAWHLHSFAQDIASIAGDLADHAKEIDKAAHSLHDLSRESDFETAQDERDYRERIARWFDRLAEETRREAA